MSAGKRIGMAALAGLLPSGSLSLLSYSTKSPFWVWPQMVGFYLTLIFRGFHSASEIDFLMISVPTNALVYASVIFGLSSVVGHRKSPK
jgi:hypothetical protein